ncbi:MAG: rhomboid family intramembrane serine protease [Pirellulaceae bacterium]|nr:rhomboid family intramembrane serine protease [Pirellulaceae bacterium]
MGFSDRHYEQDSYSDRSPSIFQHFLGASAVLQIILLNGFFFLLNMFVGGAENWVTANLALYSSDLTRPWFWWHLVSCGFAHSSAGIGHILGNMFGLFFLGRVVEDHYGKFEFWRFYVLSILFCSTLWLATNILFGTEKASVLGASGAVTAVILLYILNFPHRKILFMMMFPVPAWLVGGLVIGLNVIGAGTKDDNIAYDVHLYGALFAAAYFYLQWNFQRLSLHDNLEYYRQRRKEARAQKNFKIFSGEEGEQEMQLRDAKADKVLEKLAAHGKESLTKEEEKILNDYSRRMQQKHNR